MNPYIKPGMKNIDQIISETFSVPIERMKAKDRRRKREEVEARQFAMWWRDRNMKETLADIGMMYGGRDHATVIYARKTVNNLMETNKVFREKAEEALKLLEQLKF